MLTNVVQGVYHGIIPGKCPKGAQPCIWILSRPHNWRPVDATEQLILVNAATAEVVSRRRLTSRSCSWHLSMLCF